MIGTNPIPIPFLKPISFCIFRILTRISKIGFVISILCCSCSAPPPAFKGTVIEPPTDAPPVNLRDHNGKDFRISENKGKILLLFFGFTHCPDACPSTLMNWETIKKEIRANEDNVKFVFISVDPSRDSQKSLHKYVALYGDDIIGLTGTQKDLDPIYKSYGIFAEKELKKNRDYLINHTTSIILIDKQGKWRLNYSYGTSPIDIALDIKRLLSE